MSLKAIVSARTGSTRLPGKALLPLAGLPMISFLLRRLKGTRLADEVVLATTELREDDALAAAGREEGIRVFRGADEDVVKRYDDAARAIGAEHVVRVTGDCPFVDAETLDYCIAAARRLPDFDLATTKRAFPVGIDYEIYRVQALREPYLAGRLGAADREHLTKFFYDHCSEFRVEVIEPRPEWRCEGTRFTVDTAEDYEAAQRIVEALGGPDFSVATLVREARALG